jgi:hypothetical protein
VDRVANAETAAKRARWLAELGEALDEARRLTKQLGVAEGRIEAVELYARIEAVRFEVQAMRLKRSVVRAEFDPKWTDLPWQQSA